MILKPEDYVYQKLVTSPGVARLVGTRREAIVGSARELLTDRAAYDRMVGATNPYGDGNAARRIVEHLESVLR